MNFSKTFVLVIVGPTAVGKTSIALSIAGIIPCEIISADSRQIYRFMDIGTSKPSKEELREVPHHFIDILNPDEDYSAGQFSDQARETIQNIFSADKIPLVVGGSGLYIRALLEGFFGMNYRDEKIRKQLVAQLEDKGVFSLYHELEFVDPIFAKDIHPNDAKRIIRGLEIYYISGKPVSELYAHKDAAPFSWVKFGLNTERKLLYKMINKRVDTMFKMGFIEEVKQLLEKGYSSNLNSLNSVGYKELIQFLKNKIDYSECVDLIKRNTRRYAKRQLTWFKAEKDIHWISIQPEQDHVSAIAREIIQEFESAKLKELSG
jgi:tRNA dimethylallyltransferase